MFSGCQCRPELLFYFTLLRSWTDKKSHLHYGLTLTAAVIITPPSIVDFINAMFYHDSVNKKPPVNAQDIAAVTPDGATADSTPTPFDTDAKLAAVP